MAKKGRTNGYIKLDDNSIIYDVHSPCILEASAGSGKTTVLVERFIVSLIYEILSTDKHPREILTTMVAITFTRKAALEMRERIRSRIETHFNPTYLKAVILALTEYYPDLSQTKLAVQVQTLLSLREDIFQSLAYASVSTIHAFGLKLLKSYPVESGMDPGMTPQDEQGLQHLSMTSKDALMISLSRLIEQNNGSLGFLIQCLGFKKFDRELEKYFGICREKGWDYFTESIEQSGYDTYFSHFKKSDRDTPSDAYFELFDSELRPVLERLLALTIHHNEISTRTPPAAYTTLERELTHALSMPLKEIFQVNLNPKSATTTGKDQDLNNCRLDIQQQLQQLHLKIHQLLLPALHRVLTHIWKEYRHLQKDRHELSFADIEWKMLELFSKDRTFSRNILRGIRYLMLDEYQDTSRSQKELFSWFLDPKLAIHISPFIVGDPKQSIYGFRAADVKVFAETQDMFRHNYGKDSVKSLEYNYRSRIPLVNSINAVFGAVFDSDSGVKYQNQQTPEDNTKKSDSESGIYFIPNDNEKAEETARSSALQASTLIKKLMSRDKLEAKDFLLLLRKKTHANLINHTLKKEMPDIPMVNIDTSNILEQDEIIFIMDYLRALDNPRDDHLMLALLKSPFFRLSDAKIFDIYHTGQGSGRVIHKFSSMQNEDCRIFLSLLDTKKHWDIPSLVEEIVHHTGYFAYLNTLVHNKEATSNLLLFIQQLRSIQESEMFNLTEFLYFVDNVGLNLNQAQIVGENANVLRIMTIHASKGLQAPVVIYIGSGRSNKSSDILDNNKQLGLKISGKDKNYFRLQQELEHKEQQEEKRLFYVAVTRAAYQFYYLGYKQSGDDSWAHFVTPFIQPGFVDGFKDASAFINQAQDLPFVKERGSATTGEPDWESVLEQASKAFRTNVMPQVLTITQILDMEFDQASFKNKYLIRSYQVEQSLTRMLDEENDSGDFQDQRADLGTFLHLILERGDADNYRELCDSQLSRHHDHLLPQKEVILGLLQGYYSSDVYKQILSCQEIQKEWELLFPYQQENSSIIIKGVIDVYARKDEGNALVLDYKLKVKDSQLGRYSRQLQYYALFLNSMGRSVQHLYLYDLESGREYNVDYDEQEARQALDLQINHIMKQFIVLDR